MYVRSLNTLKQAVGCHGSDLKEGSGADEQWTVDSEATSNDDATLIVNHGEEGHQRVGHLIRGHSSPVEVYLMMIREPMS